MIAKVKNDEVQPINFYEGLKKVEQLTHVSSYDFVYSADVDGSYFIGVQRLRNSLTDYLEFVKQANANPDNNEDNDYIAYCLKFVRDDIEELTVYPFNHAALKKLNQALEVLDNLDLNSRLKVARA